MSQSLETPVATGKPSTELDEARALVDEVLELVQRIRMPAAVAKMRRAMVLLAELDAPPDRCNDCSSPDQGCATCDGLYIRPCECGDVVRCQACGGAR